MIRTSVMARRVILTMAMVATLHPRLARAADDETSFRVVDATSERRLTVLVGPLAAMSGTGVGFAPIPVGGRTPRAMMIHRMRADVTDSAGRPVECRCVWRARLDAGVPDSRRSGIPVLMSFGVATRELRIPKPLGYRVAARDSIVVTASLEMDADEDAGAIWVTIVIEYEPLDGPASRLAIQPAWWMEMAIDHAEAVAGDETAGHRRWEWRPQTTARLLTLSGEAIVDARELRLIDVDSGAVVWRALLARTDRDAEGATRDAFVRPGVRLQEGRTYRLVAIYGPDGAPSAAIGAAVHAMMVPCRTAPAGQ